MKLHRDSDFSYLGMATTVGLYRLQRSESRIEITAEKNCRVSVHVTDGLHILCCHESDMSMDPKVGSMIPEDLSTNCSIGSMIQSDPMVKFDNRSWIPLDP